MSVARVYTVQHAAKDQGKCEHDGTPLPKGSPYRWYTIGFRSKLKHKRCMNPTCTPKRYELESSALSAVMQAQDSAQATLDSIRGWDMTDGAEIVRDTAQAALAGVADAGDEVVQQWRDAAENFGGVGDNADKADELEGLLEPLRDWQPDNDEPDCRCTDDDNGHTVLTDGCDDCADEWQSWLDEVMDSASDALAEVA